MGSKRRKTRVSCKIDELPEEVHREVDEMLATTKTTYAEISAYLKSKGYDISLSAVGRYAIRMGAAVRRLQEARQQTEALLKVVQQNPDADYTEAGIMILMDGLVKRLATAEDEFDKMPLEKAGKLVASISRTKIYKDRVRQDMQKRADIAFKKLEGELLETIKNDPEISGKLKSILQEAKEKLMNDD